MRASNAAVALATSIALAAPVRGGDKAPKADRVFVNGHVWTGEKTKPLAEGIAVRGTRIIALGTTRDIAKLASRLSDTVDLKGQWVYPGFNDAHLHFLVPERADLAGAGSLTEIQRRVVEFASRHPEAPWILGHGWSYADLPDGTPHKKLLDAVLSDRPVWLGDRDGHAGWCNSRALEMAKVGKGSADPPWGTMVRDARGEPTGFFKEAGAMDLVRTSIPPPNDEERYRALKALLAKAASRGLTSAQNASFSFDEMPVFQRVIDENGLKVRFRWALLFDKRQNPDELARYRDVSARMTRPTFKFGAAKAMIDGTLSSRTAAMFEPFLSGGVGTPFWTQDDLNDAVAHYEREGLQILLHAVGDRAINMALNAYEYAQKTNKMSGRRHRIEHAEVPRPSDIPRFRELGVVASTQPMFMNPLKATMDLFNDLLGPDRAARADAFKTWDDLGVVQAFGSDWPVTPMDPLRQMYCAVTRMTEEGTPTGGFHPESALTVEAALRHFTIDSAYASLDEGEKGSLAPGKLADFTVLSTNILESPPQTLLTAKVLLTVMGGQDTFRAPGF